MIKRYAKVFKLNLLCNPEDLERLLSFASKVTMTALYYIRLYDLLEKRSNKKTPAERKPAGAILREGSLEIGEGVVLEVRDGFGTMPNAECHIMPGGELRVILP